MLWETGLEVSYIRRQIEKVHTLGDEMSKFPTLLYSGRKFQTLGDFCTLGDRERKFHHWETEILRS
jgi:hypothetical protein